MARLHYFSFITDSEGTAIPEVQVSIYLAGTSTPANIYKSEFGTSWSNESPQLLTNKVGYFEFWISADTETEQGYSIGQKFKISWWKEGITSGYIDYVDILPYGLLPVSFDSMDDTFNKLVSNKTLSMLKGVQLFVDDTEWTELGGKYYVDVEHNLNEEYPVITIWNSSTKKIITPFEIESVNENMTRITLESELNVNIRISK
jgi:hypothetical protein